MLAPVPFDMDRGKSIRVRQSLRHLRDLGHQIDLVTYPTGKAVQEDGVEVFRASDLFSQKDPQTPGISFRQLLSNADLLRIATKRIPIGEYDAIHAHDVDGAIIGHAARMLRQVTVPLVYDMHGTFSELNRVYGIVPSAAFAARLDGYLHDVSDHLIANWPHVADSIDSSHSSTLIFDEPDVRVQRALEEDLDPLESWERGSYVLYTGNYADYQGVELLLRSFELLERECSLVLTGDPPAEYVVDDHSVVYTGYVDESTLARYLQNADVLVSPRRTDGFPPMKVLYYLRCRAPIVATDLRCHRSILEEVAGTIFCDESAEGMADGLREALDSTERYDREPLQEDVSGKYDAVYATLHTDE